MNPQLRPVSEILPQTRVILRMDTDLPIEDGQILDNSRLVKSLPTIKLLLDKGCNLAIIGHRGRPNGNNSEELSLRPVYLELMSLIETDPEYIVDSVFMDDFGDESKIDLAMADNNIVFMENLRFQGGEDEGDSRFLEPLIRISQFFVNDAFAVAHRKNASVLLWQKMPAFYGISFIEENNKILKVLDRAKRPLTVVLGGAKEDKLKHLSELERIADFVLIGGKLPKIANRKEIVYDEDKVVWAKLKSNGLDLDREDIEKFKEIITKSKTIVWAGAMGYFESPEERKGTYEVAEAVANAEGYKIIAGGDTGASIAKLGLSEKIDFICSGGGVMLELLTKGSLPAWPGSQR